MATEVMRTIANEIRAGPSISRCSCTTSPRAATATIPMLGAEIALKLGPRLGLTDEETETASWLVRYHLLMTRTAFKRDIDDPKTIADFVAVVQSPERLKLLLVLTVADIRAVGPAVWNDWKAGLLRDALPPRARHDVGRHRRRAARAPRRRGAGRLARRACSRTSGSADEIEAHLARGYPSYWVSFDTATHLRHARLMREAEAAAAPLTVDWRVDRGPARVTEITLYTGDHAGLFSQIAGAMALSGASIVDAKIITMTNGMALDTFLIQDAEGGGLRQSDALAKLSTNIEQALAGRIASRPRSGQARAPASSSRDAPVPRAAARDHRQ